MRASGAYSARTLAVEVQQCALRSDPGGSGPAVLTAILNWQRGWARHLAKRIGEEEEEEEQTALIQFNNPHLAGGKKSYLVSNQKFRKYPASRIHQGPADLADLK